MMRDKADVIRTGFLGTEGERLAFEILKRAGFMEIEKLPPFHPFADYIAALNGQLYAISVKARNKYAKESNRQRVNDRYKLGKAKNCLMHAAKLKSERGAEPAWLTIAMDETEYDAYFGTVALLQSGLVKGRKLNGKGVIMRPEYFVHYQELAKGSPHNLRPEKFQNEQLKP